MKTLALIFLMTLSSFALAEDSPYEASEGLKQAVLENLKDVRHVLEHRGDAAINFDEATLQCMGLLTEKYGIAGSCVIKGTIPEWTVDIIAMINVFGTAPFTFEVTSTDYHQD